MTRVAAKLHAVHARRHRNLVGAGFAALILGSGAAMAQQEGGGTGQAAPATTEGSGATAVPDAPSGPGLSTRNWRLEPSASVSEMVTSNHGLNDDGQADSITTLSGNVRAVSSAGPVRGMLDYTLSGLLYARNSADNDIQHDLSANGTAELVGDHVFLDARVAVSRQRASVFATQAIDQSRDGGNAVTVKQGSLSPYLRGRMFYVVDYEVRARYDVVRTRAGDPSNSEVGTGSFRLEQSTGLVGWSLEGEQQVSRFTGRSRAEDTRARLGVSAEPVESVKVAGFAGHESGTLDGTERKAGTTLGVRANWTPSPQLTVGAEYEDRPFGHTYKLAGLRTMSRATFGFSETRSFVIGNRGSLSTTTSAYDLLFQQFASTTPDPVQRDAAVRDFMVANGIDPAATVTSTFLTAVNTVRRVDEATMTLTFPRDTLTLQARYDESRRLDLVTGAADDFTSSEVVKLFGVAGTVSHRLTPLSTAGLVANYQLNRGDDSAPRTTLKAVSATFSTRMGPLTNLSALARYTVFDSPTDPYREAALAVALQHRFY